jgi:hypothetical protein
MNMQARTLTLPEFMFVVGTRGMLGLGVGLLLSDKLSAPARRALGITLTSIGAATTIPAAMFVFGKRPQLTVAIR